MKRGTALLLLLMLGAMSAPAVADKSATERLMRVADCIRDAGDLKGAPREAFMNKCLGSEAALMAPTVTRKAAPVRASQEPPAPASAVAPTPVPVPASDGLPPQERILGCASASKDMQGDKRAAYLKDCLAGRIQEPAIDVELARRRAACAAQAARQASAGEHEAFIAACLRNGGTGAAGAAPLRDEQESRRRAACHVMARDQQGAARKRFIDACLAARPALAGQAPVVQQRADLATREQLVRSKRCAEQARAEAVENGQLRDYMNTCMAPP
jgi:hypothetical protein